MVLFVHLYAYIFVRAHIKEGIAKGKDKRGRAAGGRSDERKVSRGCIQTYLSFVDRQRGESSVIVLSAKGGFILSRFTMLYSVGSAASTNNCQLNIRRIDRPRYQLRESNGYPSIKESGDFLLLFCRFLI